MKRLNRSSVWRDRIERALWLAFLFALPLQARIVMWQADPAFVEWRAVTLFATDLLWAALVALAAVRLVSNWKLTTENCQLSPWDWALLVLIGAAAVSAFRASLVPVAWVSVARLVQGVTLYAYVRWYVPGRFSADLSLGAFLTGTFAQALLGIGQFLVQHDLGFRIAGETLLRPTMRGVAVFYDLANEKVLRAYGTLPHPNVLAAVLVGGLFTYGYLYLRHAAATVRRAWFVWLTIGLPLVWALCATFSRTVIAAATLALGALSVALGADRISGSWPNVVRCRIRGRQLFIGAAVAVLLFTVLFWPQVLARAGISPSEEAVQLRVFYNDVALRSGEGLFGVNWFGSGIGNFVSWMREANPNLPAWQYQPAHNLYLLVYTETGIVGLAALLTFTVLAVRALARASRTEPLVRWGLLALVGVLLSVSLFDHFPWTLQQGRLFWWMTWGTLAALVDRSATAGTN